MSLVGVSEHNSLSLKQPWRVKLVSHFTCDVCNKRFESVFNNKHLKSEFLSYCSIPCLRNSRKVGGIQYERSKKACIEKYGVSHTNLLKETKEKSRATKISRYGDENFNNRLKCKETCKEKYGVENVFQSEEIKKKSENTHIMNSGVSHPSKNKNACKKTKETLMLRYGVDHGFKTKRNREVVTSDVSKKKRHETMKLLNRYGKSKIEDMFSSFLSYSFNTVERQIPLNGWLIDFYLPNESTYIQFNGDYWHGVNHSLDELLVSESKQKQNIAKTKIRDEKRDVWFKENKLKLIIVLESEFKQNKLDMILNRIRGVNV